MSRAEKAKPIVAQSEDVAAFRARQADMASNAPLQRNIQAALANELQNVRGLFAQGLADLKKATVNKDKNVPGRDSYDRCYRRVTGVAERLATIVPEGEQVRMPAWIAPPEVTAADTVVVGKPGFDIGTYTETKGHGPSGKGLPIKGPGSNVDPDWPVA